MKSLEDLQKTLKKKEVTSRFLTIGFTNEHDAKFLNSIAQSGTDLGNFFYVNTEKPDYPDQIKECLSSSLQMAKEEDGLVLQLVVPGQDKFKIVLPKCLEEVDDEGEMLDPQDGQAAKKTIEEVKVHDLKYDFTSTTFIKKSDIESLQGYLELPNGLKGNIKLEKTCVPDPSPEVQAKASVQLINKLIFDAIQDVQSDDKKRKRNNQEMYEYVKTLDSELDEYATIAFKIRDRDVRKEILAEIQDCKDKAFNFMEVLRSTQGKIPNAQIAKLNDLAYKGVKKRGMQKKLDERALKNEQFYKKLTK